jgi:MFS family permease
MPESARVSRPALKPAWTLFTHAERCRFLLVLFIVAACNNFDRNVISVLLEPIKQELQVSDTLLGLLSGFCFAFFYAVAGIPLARWADRGNRKTVVSVAVAAWSAMTACCGLAQTFWQLALARIGVGIGEAGAIPPAQSLIVDYFPPERRASALAVLTSAATVGYLLGFGLGGYIAATHGWRAVFLLAGLPGLGLALLARYALAEPRLRLGFPSARAPAETFRESIARLRCKRSYVHALWGCVLYFMFAYGGLVFVPSFLVRVLNQPLGSISMVYALIAASATLIGTLGGGWLTDRLGRRDARWLAWIPALTFAATAPMFASAFWGKEIFAFYTFAFMGWLLLGGGFPAIFAVVHAVCGDIRRSTAIAIVLFCATIIGGGLGPLVTGALSDVLSAHYGAGGLRYSLIAITSVLVPCAAFFYAAGRSLPHDLENQPEP